MGRVTSRAPCGTRECKRTRHDAPDVLFARPSPAMPCLRIVHHVCRTRTAYAPVFETRVPSYGHVYRPLL